MSNGGLHSIVETDRARGSQGILKEEVAFELSHKDV